MNSKKLTLITIALIALISLSNLNFQKRKAEASPTAHLYIEPTPATQTPGENFTVAIMVEQSPQLYAWYINLTWNPTVIKLVHVEEGTFLNQYGTRKTDMVVRINNTAGYIHFACSLLGEPPSAQPQGSGTLAELTFNVLSIGETPLHFAEIILLDYWWEQKGPRPHTETDGYFKYPIFTVSIQPTYFHQPLAAGEKFNISIVTFVENLFSWNATISWDPTILEAKRVFEGSFLSMDGTQTTQFNHEIFANYTVINGTLISPAQPVNSTVENPGTLAIIEFEVKSLGVTDITFKEVNLFDINGDSIERAYVNGRFSNIWRDVKVEVTVSELKVKPGQNVTITVTVKNLGNVPETFEVKVYVGYTLIGSQTVSLDSGETDTLTFTWSSNDAGSYQIKALVDALPEEVNVGDNISSVSLSVESPSASIPIEIVAAIIIVVVVIALAAVLLKRRKVKTS